MRFARPPCGRESNRAARGSGPGTPPRTPRPDPAWSRTPAQSHTKGDLQEWEAGRARTHGHSHLAGCWIGAREVEARAVDARVRCAGRLRGPAAWEKVSGARWSTAAPAGGGLGAEVAGPPGPRVGLARQARSRAVRCARCGGRGGEGEKCSPVLSPAVQSEQSDHDERTHSHHSWECRLHERRARRAEDVGIAPRSEPGLPVPVGLIAPGATWRRRAERRDHPPTLHPDP